MFERIRPRNWLDALGLGIQIVAVLLIFDAIIRTWGLDTTNLPLAMGLNLAGIALSLCGWLVRRVARNEPIFGGRRRAGG
jgi:hypothetical protein